MKRNYRRRKMVEIKILCYSAEFIDLLCFDLNIFTASCFMTVFLLFFCRLGTQRAGHIMAFR